MSFALVLIWSYLLFYGAGVKVSIKKNVFFPEKIFLIRERIKGNEREDRSHLKYESKKLQSTSYEGFFLGSLI